MFTANIDDRIKTEDNQVVLVGGGLTTDDLVYSLRAFGGGDIKVDERITNENYPTTDGPPRLVRCCLQRFTCKDDEKPTIADLLIAQRRRLASWEAGLLAFFNWRRYIRYGGPSIGLVTHDAPIVDRQVKMLVLCPGGDSPVLRSEEHGKQEVFPCTYFIEAWAIPCRGV